MKRKDKILYSNLNGMQHDTAVDKICDDIKNSISHGEVIFDDYQKTKDFDCKGIRWNLSIEIIK